MFSGGVLVIRKMASSFSVVTFALLFLCCGVLAQGEIRVGAYYYPWYGPAAHSTQQSLRGRLIPEQYPAMGKYDTRGAEVIEAHIRQSVLANIDFWAVSWWGPGTYEDQALKQNILMHELAGVLRYAILYESTGRLGSFSSPDYSNLVPDFEYLATNFFSDPNYLRLDGRPVVFIYLTRVYFRGQGDEALSSLRSAFPDLYIVADDVFGRYYSSVDASKWDAVTAYDVYGQSLGGYGSTQAAIDYLGQIQYDARTAANLAGVGFIPFSTPGFNDKAVRPGHRVAPRYFEDNPASEGGDVFRAILRDTAVPHVDPLASNILMVTSFNEWHEDTQIEPTSGLGTSTSKDVSASGIEYTQGYVYTDYGGLYLDILRQETAGPVQQAIEQAEDGDVVTIGPGVYRENINFLGKNITLRSVVPDDPCVVSGTVLLGNGRYAVVSFSGGENGSCLLTGFTITNENRGIYCSDACPTITNCNIVENGGVGIEAHGTLGRSSPTIINCTIAGNGGAGIYARARKTPAITNCIIVGNKGAGLDVDENSTITNCTIVGNEMSGISAYRATVTNSIIWGNSPQQIVDDYNNCSVNYSNIQGDWSGDGNIDVDPCFADIANSDYHLKSEAGRWEANSQTWVQDDVTSLCMDAGDTGSDWTGELWPHGKRINMGAYGGTPAASMSPSGVGNKADLNNDDAVNFRDFAYLADSWQVQEAPLAENLDRHGTVDFKDIYIFAENWLAVVIE